MYVFDKANARIGEGYIILSNVAAGETVKFQVTLLASGSPSSVALAIAAPSAPSTVSITGAAFTLDGNAAGVTPKIIDVAIGKHTLEFAKEGFNTGRFPLEIASHDTSGGSVSYELGNAAQDTIELRDAGRRFDFD